VTDWIEHDGGPQPVAYDFSQYVRHLIDAARLEGIRLGLEAAAREIVERVKLASTTDAGDEWLRTDHMLADIRALDPATIAREAVLDKLASEAQEQGMGYDRNVRYGVKVVRQQMFAPLTAKEADQ
jgi:hypothetical protein